MTSAAPGDATPGLPVAAVRPLVDAALAELEQRPDDPNLHKRLVELAVHGDLYVEVAEALRALAARRPEHAGLLDAQRRKLAEVAALEKLSRGAPVAAPPSGGRLLRALLVAVVVAFSLGLLARASRDVLGVITGR